MDKLIKRFQVSGRVQGVSFRASTQREAQRLNLRGWVKNCSDGSVETVAAGTPDALAIFEKWLHQGPRFAAVTSVTVRDAQDYSDATLPSPFRVTYD